MKQSKFSLKKRLKSFSYAFNGLRLLIKEEHNAWIHLLATICVVIFGFLLSLSPLEWIAVIFAIGFVFAIEAINSSIERIADFISPEKHDKIKQIKDISAAAVLIAALTALIIGLIVFVPKLINIFQ